MRAEGEKGLYAYSGVCTAETHLELAHQIEGIRGLCRWMIRSISISV